MSDMSEWQKGAAQGFSPSAPNEEAKSAEVQRLEAQVSALNAGTVRLLDIIEARGRHLDRLQERVQVLQAARDELNYELACVVEEADMRGNVLCGIVWDRTAKGRAECYWCGAHINGGDAAVLAHVTTCRPAHAPKPTPTHSVCNGELCGPPAESDKPAGAEWYCPHCGYYPGTQFIRGL